MVTDNTGSVKNAREILMKRNFRLIASQDQAHVADRLMVDIGEIEWIKEALDTVSGLVVFYRKYRRLQERLLRMMRLHNACIRARKSPTSDTVREREEPHSTDQRVAGQCTVAEVRVASTSTTGHDLNRALEDEELHLMNLPLEGFPHLQGEVGSCEEEEEDEQRSQREEQVEVVQDGLNLESAAYPVSNYSEGSPALFPAVGPLCRTIKPVFNVRFASSEKLLMKYRNVRHILKMWVTVNAFHDLFTPQGARDRNFRQSSFVGPILDEKLFGRIEQARRILQICRTYLRVFDAEMALCLEVSEATRILENSLRRLPLPNYPVPRQQNREKLIRVFLNRKEGPLDGIKKVKITLLSSVHYAPALLDPFRTHLENFWHYMEYFRQHLKYYMEGNSAGTLGRSEEQFINQMVAQYIEGRDIWAHVGLLRTETDSASGMTELLRSKCSKSPI